MRCSKCGGDNREERKFCASCGAPILAACPKCGASNQRGERFCGECGASLVDVDQATVAKAAPTVVSAAGERRHLTVLFCDLVGSTEIAARLDPEEWRETVAGYLRAAAGAITRFGGHVAKYLGDGVMAFFGYPEAHDNDAERAARAGLAILDAIAKLNEHSGRPKLSARVGIDSGAVVVGAGAGKDADVFGDAPNIAARVQGAAEPDTVLITDAVHRLISGLFVVEDRGAQPLKGIEPPTRLYRVIQPSGVRGRLEAVAAARGLTPFVGREDELRLLMNRWERALEGEGQVALIIGEAGIGKSRLVQRFHEQIKGMPHTWVEAAGAPFYQNTPFYPVSEVLRRLVWEQSFDRLDDHLRELQITEKEHGGKNALRREEAADEQLAQLECGLTTAGLKPAETIPLIAPLLNLPLTEKYPPSSFSPEQQRRRLLATLVEWMLGAARVRPLVIAIEDLHWADPSTLELIQLLLEQGARSRLLLLYTARPEFHAQWPLQAHHTQINLNRLSSRNAREMIAQVAAHNALASETVEAVIERTSGVPLFVEELTRSLLESGARLSEREIPVTLHDSLMARLDRLGPAKEVAQVGAVVGGEFSYELIRAVHPIMENDLQEALRTLANADLLYVRGIPPEATYQFKHALIRDAAYEALLKSRRRELHRQVAATIAEKFPAVKEAHPEVLARHWTEAGELAQAVTQWSRASESSIARNAFIEAQESVQQALTLLNLLPESAERDRQELKLRQSLVSMLNMTRGYTARETLQALKQVGALAKKSGNLRSLLSSMTMSSVRACIAGDLSTAAALADEALGLALLEGNPTTMAAMHTNQLVVRCYRGDLAGAENHFAAGLKFFNDPVFRRQPDFGAIIPFGWASVNAWILGRADVARERLAKMSAAEHPANPHNLQWTAHLAAYLYTLMREFETAETLAARSLDLCEKHQFPNDAGYSQCDLGYARAQLGRTAGGIALLRQGINALLQIGSRAIVTTFMTNLAAAQLRAAATSDGLETVEQALNFNPEEAIGRPETLRIRGELRLAQEEGQLAEADFRDSISVARSMGAKAWELRTTMSLARLLDQQGHREEARAMLTEIYNWFTEGFDTLDLKEAKTLLDELTGYE